MGGKIGAAHDEVNVGSDAGLSGGFAGLSAELNAGFKEVVTESGNSIFVDTVTGCPEGNFGGNPDFLNS